ncbi:MAG: CHAT domain-containing protein [Oculatellaceae cyanobacterium bins.114]|nr:CHAT domain-containing protein [Oculatellaceae cyanobacterium bins.114]
MSAIASRLWFLSLVSCGILPLLTALPVQAQSVRSEPNSAGTVVDQDGSRFTITGGTQSGNNLFHSFERFGLSAAEIASFVSRPDIQNILGRVTGGQASLIDGLLQVTGGNSNLYLLNPAGILFGANARLDLPASFYATTATGIGFGNNTFNAVGSNNYAALIGDPDSFAFTLSQAGAIVNAGNLAVNPGESVGLIGGTVVNTGTISAPGGTITLAAIPGVNRLRVSQEGSLLSLELDSPNGSWEAGINPLPFSPLSLPELLTGGEIATATAIVTNPDGTIQLGGTSVPVQPGTTIASGTLDTSIRTDVTNRVSSIPQINVLGDRVALLNANLDASGTDGGGTVRIGGDYQGQGTVFNASRTYVSADSQITANAINQGDGGRIITWADDATRFYGSLTARGGNLGGNGGFAEVSGLNYLDFTGVADLTAPLGQVGTLLLDPTDIEVVVGANLPPQLAANDQFADPDTNPPGFRNTINNGTINNALTNVVLQATNLILFNAPINTIPGVGLTVEANTIDVSSPITTSGGALSLLATGPAILRQPISTQGGNITVTGTAGASSAQGIRTLGAATIDSGGGAITFTGTSAINDGILTQAAINSGGGAIILRGTSTGNDPNQSPRGISIAGSVTSGNGDITMTGDSAFGTGVIVSSAINSGTGNISLFGTSTGSGVSGDFTLRGVELGFDGDITSTSGTITLTGTSAQDEGILTYGSIDASTGNISLTGTTTGTGTGRTVTSGGRTGEVFPDGLAIDSPITTNGGAIALNGSGANSGLTIYISATATPGRLDAGSGDVTVNVNDSNLISRGTIRGGDIRLTAGEIDLLGSLTGTTVTLQPGTTTQAIALGGTTDSGSDTLDLLNSDLQNITATTSLLIGRADGSNTVTVESNNPSVPSSTSVQGVSTLSGGSSDNVWRITGVETGTVNGIRFTSVSDLQGGGGDDSFTVEEGGSIFGTLSGGGGTNTLTAEGSSINSWTITGRNAGSLNLINFTGFQLLNGSSGNDEFTLSSSGFVTGAISGGDGTNTLVGGGFGSNENNNWVITGSNAGSVNRTDFTNFQELSGSAGDDTFQFTTDTPFAGNIEGYGGILRLTGTTVNLTGNITSSPITSIGSTLAAIQIEVEANQNIRVGNITTSSTDNSSITLTSQTGSVTTGDLRAAASPGNITITAREAITTGIIDTSNPFGDGGNVTLDPNGDIQVTSINADGGTSSSSSGSSTGRGGIIDITTERFFRATGSFTNRNGLLSSISAAGGSGNGTVIIRHGGNGETPFVIGASFSGSDFTGINGTAAAITNGVDTFSVGESFEGSITRGNLQLITGGDDSDPDECELADCGDDDEYDYEEEYAEEYDIEEPLAHDSLLNIQQQTGIKPALIYVSFVSADVPIATTFERQEAIATQQFTSHLDRPNPTQPPTLAIAPQDTDELTLLLVTPSGETIYHRVQGATRARVIQASQQLRAAVTDPRLVRTRTYLPAAQQLYEWIITPLEADLKANEIENIGFILDSGLRTIPLAALHDGQDFLIQNYSLGLIPSLNLVDTRYRDIRNSSVLAAGTSNFQRFGLDPLPAVPAELEAISDLWQGQTSTLEGNQFTVAQLQAARLERPFGIVHLATHGEFVPGNLSNSYIQFSDTRLRLDQIRTLGFNDPPVDLMVLSACRMALGSETAELGFAGLAVQAGVKTALASLWSISDEGTLGLMTEFYEELRHQPIKAEALRQAQLAMAEGRVRVQGDRLIFVNADGEDVALNLPDTLGDRGNRDFVHPYYWAGFTLVGSPW